MTARELMSTEVVTVRPDDTVRKAAAIMSEHGHGALPVVDEDGRVVGIISEADLLRAVLPDYVSSLDDLSFLPGDLDIGDGKERNVGSLPVASLMRTEAVYTVTEDDPVAEIIRIMLQYHVRRTPVLRDGKLVGIVSQSDLVRAIVHPALADREVE